MREFVLVLHGDATGSSVLQNSATWRQKLGIGPSGCGIDPALSANNQRELVKMLRRRGEKVLPQRNLPNTRALIAGLVPLKGFAIDNSSGN